jgi:hypothetical protein
MIDCGGDFTHATQDRDHGALESHMRTIGPTNYDIAQYSSSSGFSIPDHGSDCVKFESGHVGLSGQKSWPAPDLSHMWVGSGLVEFRVFSYNFQVESGWVKFFKFG